MGFDGLMPQRGLWIFVIVVQLITLAWYLVWPSINDDWPYIEGKYKSATQYQSAKLFGMLVGWVLGTLTLVARFLVGVAILRFIGWL
jgi:hypothetical protein